MLTQAGPNANVQQHKGQWLMCMAFPWLMFCSSAIWTSTASITVLMGEYYGLSNDIVAQLPNLMFAIIYILLGLESAYITRRLTVYKTLILCALLMVLGDACRLLCGLGFGWLMLGNILVAIPAPLLFSNLSYISMVCISAERQGLYLGIASMIEALGYAWGFVVSSILIQTPAAYGVRFPKIEVLYLAINCACLLAMVCANQEHQLMVKEQRARRERERKWRQRQRKKRTYNNNQSAAVALDVQDDSSKSTGVMAVEQEQKQRRRTSSSRIAGAADTCAADLEDRTGCAPFAQLPARTRVSIVVAVVVAGVLNGASNAVTNVLEQVQLNDGYNSQTVLVSGLLYLLPPIPTPWMFGWVIDRTIRWAALICSLVFFFTAVLQIAIFVTVPTSLSSFYAVILLYGITTTALTTVLLAFTNKWTNRNDSMNVNSVYAWINRFCTFLGTLLFTLLSVQQCTTIFLVVAAVCGVASIPLSCL